MVDSADLTPDVQELQEKPVMRNVNRESQHPLVANAEEKSLHSVNVNEDRFPDPGIDAEPVVTFKTWIVCVILSLGYGFSFWPVPVLSAIGSSVSADLGSPSGYSWYVSAWTIAITMSFFWLGPNTDLLGRRWFLVGGNLICFAGHIIIGTAKKSDQITAGMVIIGFGGGCCQMAAFALPELLPKKWRHIGVVIADVTVYVTVIVAPVTARFGYELNTWRWNFYGIAIAQFLSFLGLFFLYFPPAHPAGLPIKQVLRELDYLGVLLSGIGCVPVLIGIVWAGMYKSTDAHVVAPLVLGFFFIVVFALWEMFGKLKHPITPTHIFTSSMGRDFTAPAIALGIINMFYYSSSILWPQMITAFYTNGGTDWKYAMTLSLPQGFGISFGAVLLTIFGSKIRRWQWQLTVSSFIMVLFGSLLGMATPNNKGAMIAFLFLSQLGYGWAIYLAIAISQMGVEHRDLGIAGGLSGAVRFAAGAIATAVYTTIFTNTLTSEETKRIPAAAIQAGLPQANVTSLMSTFSNATALAENYSPQVVAAVADAVNNSYSQSIFLVAMASLAFGVVGLIACALCKDVDSKMTKEIEVYLENTEYADRNRFH